MNTRAGNLVHGAQGSVGKQQVLSGIDDTTNKFMMQAAPESDLNAIRAVADEFANHPAITGEQIPVQLAQKLKEGTYDVLRGKYGEVGSASTEAQKAIARRLRQGVEEAVPAVVPLNAEQHALLRTLDVVERRAAMDLAKDPAQLTGMLRSPAAWAAFTANKSSMFKAVVAQMLDSVGNALKSKAPRQVGPEPLSLAPLGEQIAPATPGFSSAPVQSRGLLGLSEGEGATAGLQMPAVDFPIQPRAGPLFNPAAERPVGPGTSSPDYFRMPEVTPQPPTIRPTSELADLRTDASIPMGFPRNPRTELKTADIGPHVQTYNYEGGLDYPSPATAYQIPTRRMELDAIANTERMLDQRRLAETIRRTREEAKGFEEIARRADNKQQAQTALMRRHELMSYADSLEEGMLQGRPDTSVKQQGPKTRQYRNDMAEQLMRGMQ